MVSGSTGLSPTQSLQRIFSLWFIEFPVGSTSFFVTVFGVSLEFTRKYVPTDVGTQIRLETDVGGL